MGGRAALFEWKSGDVWRVVRGRDAVSCGDRQAAPFGGDLSDSDGVELSRWVDVSGRGVRAVVQRIMEHRTGDEHDAAARRREQRTCGDEDFAADGLCRARCSFDDGDCALLQGLAGASELRRVLETVVD